MNILFKEKSVLEMNFIISNTFSIYKRGEFNNSFFANEIDLATLPASNGLETLAYFNVSK